MGALMGGPGSGRFPQSKEAQLLALSEEQDKFRMQFYRLAGTEYPDDDQTPKRTYTQVIIATGLEAAITMYKKNGSVKGLELVLPYLIGVPRQGITIEGSMTHQVIQEWDLSKLSDAELEQFKTLLEMTMPPVCKNCGSSCGGNCHKSLPEPVQ